MIQLDILNETGIYIDQTNIESVIRKVLGEKGVTGSVELSLSVVGEAKMRKLHRKYMETDEVTDVLSFPTEEDMAADGVRHLGDIVICEVFYADVEFLVEHGLRHLLGEHHETG